MKWKWKWTVLTTEWFKTNCNDLFCSRFVWKNFFFSIIFSRKETRFSSISTIFQFFHHGVNHPMASLRFCLKNHLFNQFWSFFLKICLDNSIFSLNFSIKKHAFSPFPTIFQHFHHFFWAFLSISVVGLHHLPPWLSTIPSRRVFVSDFFAQRIQNGLSSPSLNWDWQRSVHKFDENISDQWIER